MAFVIGPIKAPDTSIYIGKIIFRSLSTPAIVSGGLVIGQDTAAITANDGSFRQQLEAGEYKVWIGSDPNSMAVVITVPNDGLDYPIASLIRSSFVWRLSDPPYSDRRLLEMAGAGAFQILDPVPDGNDIIATAPVLWPDGSPGVFTVLVANASFAAIDSWRVTHQLSGKTITQPAMSRSATGFPTSIPALQITTT